MVVKLVEHNTTPAHSVYIINMMLMTCAEEGYLTIGIVHPSRRSCDVVRRL